MKKKQNDKLEALNARLQAIDFDSLPISAYNKRYIGRLKPVLPYYLEIYSRCIRKGLAPTGKQPSETILVDYGGGSGFLSMLAKELGIGRVIYIDLNPHSVKTVEILKERTGIGPDVILEGDSNRLAAWCAARSIRPQVLIATDLIEHVYDLDVCFRDLSGISDRLEMVFTTASTPYNPWVKRRLHRMMRTCEYENGESPAYRTSRLHYIREKYPDFSEEEADNWARQTRGLIYRDIRKAIDEGIYPRLPGPYNTCDPATGNWTERILPIGAYRTILDRYGYKLKVEKGFYNIRRGRRIADGAFRLLNGLIRYSGWLGFGIAPFIFLTCRRQATESTQNVPAL